MYAVVSCRLREQNHVRTHYCPLVGLLRRFLQSANTHVNDKVGQPSLAANFQPIVVADKINWGLTGAVTKASLQSRVSGDGRGGGGIILEVR